MGCDMDRKPEVPGAYKVFPDHAEPCVWMVAGLLGYRICDRDFDCEHCPLDAAIHGAHGGRDPGTVEEPGEDAPDWGIRDGLAYHPVYGWVAEAAEGRVRWGIDGLSARLLDHLTEVVVPPSGSEIAVGKFACWVMDDGELVPLRAPVSGRVARANPALGREPTLVTHDPYGDGWLLELECAGDLSVQPGLCDGPERRRRAAWQMRRFHRDAAAYLRLDPTIGPTAQDGGERLPGLRRMLGRERYHRLVFALLR